MGEEKCCLDRDNWDLEHTLKNRGVYCLSCGSKIWPEKQQDSTQQNNQKLEG